MRFDKVIDRRGTHCSKWDDMEQIYGVSADDGLAMWVADMDFAAADPIRDALRQMVDHGVFGYFADQSAYHAAICWWMDTRHGWQVDPGAIFTTHGLVNGVAMCVDTWTEPGDGVVLHPRLPRLCAGDPRRRTRSARMPSGPSRQRLCHGFRGL